MNESPSKQSLSHIENCDVKSSEDDLERLLDWHSKENPVDESTFWLSSETPQTTTPLLFVDVNAGWGRIERVTIHQGDTPETLAEQFAKKHGKKLTLDLNEKTRAKLKLMFSQQMEGVLGAI